MLTANLVLDKATNAGLPVWIVSLDLSKAFDRVKWEALWDALAADGISKHLICVLQLLYHDQCGEILGDWGRSREFHIRAGVRQGCVLSPRLFCSVLQLAMRKWRGNTGLVGFDLLDGLPWLVDLRFADDILLFGRDRAEVSSILDSLIVHLEEVGLMVNEDKTVVLTSEAQPPDFLSTPGGLSLKVFHGNMCHKWLGCMLTATGSVNQSVDARYHLQQACKAYHANKWALQDKKVSIICITFKR